MNNCILSFSSERFDLLLDAFHLGLGYRNYKPVLMRFDCPDSWSPFAAGGINPYIYCLGDPVNCADPSGHLSWQSWLGIGMGAIGVGLTIFSAGTSVAAAGGIMAALESGPALSLIVSAVSVISDVAAIASGVCEESSGKTSTLLAWISMATGASGLASGLYRSAVQNLRKLGNFVGDWSYQLQHAGGCLSANRATVPPVNRQSAQIQQLLQLNSESRVFHQRESMVNEYQDIASSENIYSLDRHPQISTKYIMTNLSYTHGRYPDGDYNFVIRVDRENEVLLGKIPDIPGRSAGPMEIMGHTSMTRDSAETDPVGVFYAGEIYFRQGNLIRWNNTSGHYKPSSSWAGRNMGTTVRKLLPMSKFVEDLF